MSRSLALHSGLLLTLACGGGSKSVPTAQLPVAASVTIAPESDLAVGLSVPLSFTVRDSSGAVISGAPLSWQSSDITRAVVDASRGIVSGRGAGIVNITARSGSVTGTLPMTISAAPSQTACRIPRSLDAVAFGFPRDANRLRTTGTVRFNVIFVDFPDVITTGSTASLFAMISPGTESRLAAFSYDKMNAVLIPTHGWLRMSKNSTAYGYADGLSGAEHLALLQEAVNLAAPTTDFSLTDAVVVIVPPNASAISYGPAFVGIPGQGIYVQGREILSGTNSGSDFMVWGGAGWLVHELGHTLGLPDLYDYTPGVSGAHRHVGQWSQMGLISGAAPEWTAFERWQLAWLDNAQVVCAPPGDIRVALSPLGDVAEQLVLVPLSTTKLLAIESRFGGTFDTKITQPGLLVYTVDAAVANGRGPMRVQPEADTDTNKLSRTLTVGQSLVVSGVTVTFESSGTTQLVRVQR